VHVAHGAMRVVGIGDCPRGMLCLCMERLEETFVGGDGGKKNLRWSCGGGGGQR